MAGTGALRTSMLAGATVAGLLLSLGSAVVEPAVATPSLRSAPADPGWVTGVVVDENGDPVVGDLVNALAPHEVPELGILAQESDRRDLTDQNGRFRVRQAGPHGYLIQICDPEPSDRTVCRETAQGVDHLITYVGPVGTTDSWVTQNDLFDTSTGDRALGSVTVKPQSFVHGTIEGASFQSIRILRQNGTVAYYGRTDEQGRYLFQGLAPGHYQVAAGGDGWRPWRSPVFDLAPDSDLQVDGALDRGAAISGIVRSAGNPVPYLDIFVRRFGGRLVAATTTDEHGRYRVTGLLPGEFRVGVSYDGSEYRRRSVHVTLSGPHDQATAPLTVVRGAVITFDLRAGGKPAIAADDELRDGAGVPILGQRNQQGTVTYTGLAPGNYTVVAGNGTRYTMARVHVTTMRTYDLGTRVLDRPTLTVRGTTAPRAVVEAMTGNQCPPDGPVRGGSFHVIERADDAGRYTLTGLVPGNYMFGSDGWPANYAPLCRPDIPVTGDRTVALPLKPGSTVSGQLVYASNGRPVITTLAYQLTYPPGSVTNPTDEHPSRDRTSGASGLFTVDRLAAGTVTGRLSQGANLDQISSPKFFVIYPFQDGTPYYLTSAERSIDVPADTQLRIGRIPLTLHR